MKRSILWFVLSFFWLVAGFTGLSSDRSALAVGCAFLAAICYGILGFGLLMKQREKLTQKQLDWLYRLASIVTLLAALILALLVFR